MRFTYIICHNSAGHIIPGKNQTKRIRFRLGLNLGRPAVMYCWLNAQMIVLLVDRYSSELKSISIDLSSWPDIYVTTLKTDLTLVKWYQLLRNCLSSRPQYPKKGYSRYKFYRRSWSPADKSYWWTLTGQQDILVSGCTVMLAVLTPRWILIIAGWCC